MKQLLVPSLIGALVVGAIGIAAWRNSAASQPPRITDPSRVEIAALKQELEELKRSMKNSQRHAQNPVAPSDLPRVAATAAELPVPGDSAEPSIVAPEEFQATMEARREQAAKQRRERRERLDEALRMEPRDARWAAEATSTVKGWLADPGLAGYSLTELDCRSSICRARMSLPEDKKLDDFVVATQTKMGPFQTTSLHVVDNGAGEQELVAYFGKQGQSLPQ